VFWSEDIFQNDSLLRNLSRAPTGYASQPPTTRLLHAPLPGAGRYAVKTIVDTLGVARSNLAVQANTGVPVRRRGRPAKPEADDRLLDLS